MIIYTPATSANLGPGFDSLGLALKLYNEANITPQSFSSIAIKGEGEESINLKKNNTFVTIFNDIFSSLTGKTSHFKFGFTNSIAFGRGLGSSSSVIVGAIAAAHEMAGFAVKRELVLNMALAYEPHPDNIAPACFGGFTASIISGASVHTKRCDISSDLRAVMVIPSLVTSTKSSRAQLAKSVSLNDSVSNLAHASFMTACFMSADYDSMRLAAVDKLHEEARMAGVNGLFELRELAYKNGSLLSVLSGSGSSFLNIVYKGDSERLRAVLSDKFPQFRVEVLEFDNSGFRIDC